jgi:CRISPR/Cas system CSM-associated protein Csm4 (group 5 of RAMP superfamily)
MIVSAGRAQLKQLAMDSEDRKNQKKAVMIDIPEHSKDKKDTKANRKTATVDLQLKRTLVHYLAAQPRLVTECIKKTGKTRQNVLAALNLIAMPQVSNKDRYQMSNRGTL